MTRNTLAGLVLALVALLVPTKGIQAQTGFHPFFKHPVATKEEAVRAIEANDQKILTLTPEEFLARMNDEYPDLKLENIQDLAKFLRSTYQAPCAKGRVRYLRVPTGSWYRNAHPGEQCLYDKNGQVLSLYCGNPTPDLRIKPREPVVETVVREVPLGIQRIETHSTDSVFVSQRWQMPWKPIGWVAAAAAAGAAYCQFATEDFCGMRKKDETNVTQTVIVK